MRKLIDIIAMLDKLDREHVICAKPEWTVESDADVVPLTSDCRVPASVTSAGLKYFLEVDVARQVLEEFIERPDASAEERCKRLIHYAIYDA